MNNVGPGPEQRGKRSYVIPCTQKFLVTPIHVGGSEQRQACNAAETGDGLLVILSPPPSPVFSFRSLARLRPTVLPKVPFVQHLLLSASSCSARPWPAASLVKRRSAAKWGN